MLSKGENAKMKNLEEWSKAIIDNFLIFIVLVLNNSVLISTKLMIKINTYKHYAHTQNNILEQKIVKNIKYLSN